MLKHYRNFLRTLGQIELNIRIKRPEGLEWNEVTSSVFSVGKNMGERVQRSGTVKSLLVSPDRREGLIFSATFGEAEKIKVARAPKIFCCRSFFLIDINYCRRQAICPKDRAGAFVFGSFSEKELAGAKCG